MTQPKSKPKVKRVQLYDPIACKLVAARAKKENRSCSNALMVTVIEALGGDFITNPGESQPARRDFRAEIVDKGMR